MHLRDDCVERDEEEHHEEACEQPRQWPPSVRPVVARRHDGGGSRVVGSARPAGRQPDRPFGRGRGHPRALPNEGPAAVGADVGLNFVGKRSVEWTRVRIPISGVCYRRGCGGIATEGIFIERWKIRLRDAGELVSTTLLCGAEICPHTIHEQHEPTPDREYHQEEEERDALACRRVDHSSCRLAKLTDLDRFTLRNLTPVEL